MKSQMAQMNQWETSGSFLTKRILRSAIFSIGLVLSLALLTPGETARADNDSRWLTPTMTKARANMFNPELNYLLFQNMEKMFATRKVPAGGEVWRIPFSPKAVKAKFDFQGSTYELEDFLERTATNALLVIKDGQIVQEIYRNGSDEKTAFISFSMAKSFVETIR